MTAHYGAYVASRAAIGKKFKSLGKKTKYSAHVMHADEEGMKKHAAIGFHDGWGKALEQLVAVAKKL